MGNDFPIPVNGPWSLVSGLRKEPGRRFPFCKKRLPSLREQSSWLWELFPQAQSFHDASVPFDVFLHQVVQQATALTNHFQQAATGMMVLFVGFQVFGQIADPFGQDGNLYFRGPRCPVR